jgi:hypothetical protein
MLALAVPILSQRGTHGPGRSQIRLLRAMMTYDVEPVGARAQLR